MCSLLKAKIYPFKYAAIVPLQMWSYLLQYPTNIRQNLMYKQIFVHLPPHMCTNLSCMDGEHQKMFHRIKLLYLWEHLDFTSGNAIVVLMNWVWGGLNLYIRRAKIKEKSINHTLGSLHLHRCEKMGSVKGKSSNLKSWNFKVNRSIWRYVTEGHSPWYLHTPFLGYAVGETDSDEEMATLTQCWIWNHNLWLFP